MADISVTAASVLTGANAKIKNGIAGETITRGQPVYRDSTTGKLKKADANASAATSAVVGIALQDVGDGQRLDYVWDDDDFTPGATLSLSVAADTGVYVLSATAGGIAPMDDLASGWYPVVLFVAKSTTKAILKIVRGSAALTA